MRWNTESFGSDTEVYCRRDLHVGARSLPCTHPASLPVFTAESALAESCNTWFAEMGRRFSGSDLEAALRSTGLPHISMEQAGVEQRQLAVLGLSGVTASPLEMARAYRQLIEQMPPDGAVARGLRGSVEYGMANPAGVPRMLILGKTGTASDPVRRGRMGGSLGYCRGSWWSLSMCRMGMVARQRSWLDSSLLRCHVTGRCDETLVWRSEVCHNASVRFECVGARAD